MARRQALGSLGKSMLQADFSAVKSDLALLNRKMSALKEVKPAPTTTRFYSPVTVSKPKKPAKSLSAKTLYERTMSGAWIMDNLPTGRTPARPTINDIETIVTDILGENIHELKDKGYDWAVDTREMMKAVSPLRTENLVDSIKILSDEADYSVTAEQGGMVFVVGVDEQAILPPPYRKHIKHGPDAGKLAIMSPFNYTGYADAAILKYKDDSHQGYDFLNRWREIARENMERIFK